jgi:hypothetical protein
MYLSKGGRAGSWFDRLTTSGYIDIIVTALALVAAFAWPGRIIGPLDGAPFDVPAKAVVFAVVLPLLWRFHPAFLRTGMARALIVALLAWKLLAWTLLPQAGWCGTFLTKYPAEIGGYRLAPSWDVRTLWNAPPTCSAIVARGYERLTQFPAWIMNVPFGQDRPIATGELDYQPFENPRPPEAEFAMYVQGTMDTPRPGTFSVGTGSDVQLSGDIDGRPLMAVGGDTAAADLGSGTHIVNLRLDLTGRNWRFVPLWDGGDLFSAVATSTTRLTTGERVVQRLGRWVTPVLVLSLLGLWLGSAVAAWRPGSVMLGSVAVVTAAVAWAAAGGPESTGARFAVLLLAGCVFVPVPHQLRDGRGAWLLVGVPWLALLTTIVFRRIGGFTLFLLGDDTLTYQRFAHRIFMEGYWLEGGQLTFWNQPLYRWICGILHLIFGDSSAGEMLFDAFALLIGAMFAYEVANRIAGFRGGVAAAVIVLATVTLGPNWYMLGRGLSEIAATGWLYLAAFELMRARDGSIRHAWLAGGFAVLAFYTRLNHLPLIVALVALALPEGVEAGAAFTLRAWRRLPVRVVAAYGACLTAGFILFAARTWYYTGQLNPFAGTTRVHNGTGLGLTIDSLWSATAWQRALESVVMIVSVQDPPRFDVRAVMVIVGFVAAILALVRFPLARRLPLGVVVMCVAAVAGGLVARGVAYPGRFSIHLIPVAVAVSVSLCGLAVAAFRRDHQRDWPAIVNA